MKHNSGLYDDDDDGTEYSPLARVTKVGYEEGLRILRANGEITEDIYQRDLHHNVTCYLCKQRLQGGVSEMVQTDERIGFEPKLKHVFEMLDGVWPSNPDETFGQGVPIVHGMDPVICWDCLDKIEQNVKEQ